MSLMMGSGADPLILDSPSENCHPRQEGGAGATDGGPVANWTLRLLASQALAL